MAKKKYFLIAWEVCRRGKRTQGEGCVFLVGGMSLFEGVSPMERDGPEVGGDEPERRGKMSASEEKISPKEVAPK
ncbi:hypothetical protein [Ornithinibacillus sp. JPR2-1]|uniref:hypothetical protein n=1 Tax=Ornithinibacillus sp. JPR2-1 TaxID=2094019 RepID=UPI0031D1CD8D